MLLPMLKCDAARIRTKQGSEKPFAIDQKVTPTSPGLVSCHDFSSSRGTPAGKALTGNPNPNATYRVLPGTHDLMLRLGECVAFDKAGWGSSKFVVGIVQQIEEWTKSKQTGFGVIKELTETYHLARPGTSKKTKTGLLFPGDGKIASDEDIVCFERDACPKDCEWQEEHWMGGPRMEDYEIHTSGYCKWSHGGERQIDELGNEYLVVAENF